ncbi:hypothetical protein [Mesorhizobium sp. KR2-14]|uniref:hypothetical protein n=1 Tax=Mesorhizobium sp. KR2-14 TaxID=3156610 RepID=UPI0032B55B82
MSKAPENGSLKNPPHKALSPEGDAISADVVIALTITAKSYAARLDILDKVLAVVLPADCQVGDVVTLHAGGADHDFALLRRRWIAGEDGTRLEVTLDFPAQGGRG